MLSKANKDLMIYLEKYHAITINQCMRHFYKSEYRYDVARKSLRELEKKGILQSYQHGITGEKVYYYDRKVSAHDLYILEFYSLLVEHGCTNIEFIKEPRYLNNLIRADGYFSFQFEDNLYFIILEVDLNNFTSASKFQMYEKLYRDKTLEEQCFGTFPMIVIMSFNRKIRYESENFEVVYLDFSLSDFKNSILGIA